MEYYCKKKEINLSITKNLSWSHIDTENNPTRSTINEYLVDI